jgi:transposase, IS5 family
MITSINHQSWLFFLPLAQQASLLKDDLLDPVDQLLDDAALLELVRQCLAARYPKSARTGRPGMAPDRLLRCCVLKHLKGWSFRDLERELRSNLIYRRFTHFDAEAIPRYNCFSRLFAVLSPTVTEKIHQRVVNLARERGVAQGRKVRTDCTVIESNVHYPTDSTLLGDGIRVLSRSLAGIAQQCKQGTLAVVNHGRAVKYRLLEISRAAKTLTQASQQRMQDSYEKLLATTRGVVRQATEILEKWEKGKLKVVGKLQVVEAQMGQLRQFVPLVKKVIMQTKERVWQGNTHVVGKVLSLFEPHTEVIRKGKAHKPNEFGRLVRIDEVENGIVSGYEVMVGKPADTTSFLPALQQHQAVFGRAPEMAVGDRGFFSARNEREAEEMGVKKVVLPARGRLSKKRSERQKQRWFRRNTQLARRQ